jgi:hypothetical protein
MIAAREGMSGGGWTTRLRAIALWGIKAEPAGVVRGASRVTRIKPRANLEMPDAKIAPVRRSRKWYTEYQAHFSKPSSTTPTVNACVPLIQGGRNER